MSCADLRPVIDLLGLGLDDAIEEDTAAARAHLTACPACAARVASLGVAARSLATAPASAPARGRDELVARMAAAAAPEPRAGAGGWWALLVALLLAAGAAWAWRSQPPAPPDESHTSPIVPGKLDPSPAAVSSSGVIYYAAPDQPLEAADPSPAIPTFALPVGK